jgi:hypothetical protein
MTDMNVAELIVMLGQFPADMQVARGDSDWGPTITSSANVETIHQTECGHSYPCVAEGIEDRAAREACCYNCDERNPREDVLVLR